MGDTAQRNADMLREYLAGATYGEIAKRYGLCAQRITQIVHREAARAEFPPNAAAKISRQHRTEQRNHFPGVITDEGYSVRYSFDAGGIVRREIDEYISQAGEAAFEAVLAERGYVKERTCTLRGEIYGRDGTRWGRCSKCGVDIMYARHSYCWNCGARVVE